jgi:glyoxylase-like metal-dependent hydrolase (beta-lactamase superfamily II)
MHAGLQHLHINLKNTDFFITHLHADHYGLLSDLATDTSRIFFNRPEKELLETGDGWNRRIAYAMENGFPAEELRAALASHPGYRFGYDWVPGTSILNDGDELMVGRYRFLCIPTPGHSLGHTCLYETDTGILIAGDHILKDITPYIACWFDEENPLKVYFSSLDKVNAMEVDLVLPGHRRLITDHKTRINELKQHHERRLNEIVSILNQGTRTAYQAASRMSWDIDCASWDEFPPAQKWFATGEVIAHLRYLEETGSVYREVKESINRFTLNMALQDQNT